MLAKPGVIVVDLDKIRREFAYKYLTKAKQNLMSHINTAFRFVWFDVPAL